ncbi:MULTISPECIES: glycoside hydrolase family 1 protein [Streptococcus]|uniref:glycoside hydrolase family 1 protein n=1 Tax=Streptococcus TaxID=1301 RepID=UPI000CF3FC5C|nr:glycoside hydrolase family 1 protein [Streptococcus suis]NQH33072.1 glycoside hydrolase family 1 protein [Streptococcus suis]NQH96176.1 glycoside hydrolase family 1 protein [Streptococcus suis]NQO46659.1 glycoside hydrolase family 1 protein [Streptococcus suis]NQP19400.1 glycoside hydrolase family 1 protein [Streptococcus suis]UUM57645.1 glycoside hydrolase family 1 protein [Streptococcus suis]
MTEQGTFYQFPEGFLWGSSTSGPQSEGIEPGDGKGLNNWDYWFGIEPERFHGQIGPDVTSTFYKNYQTDIELLKETGHTIFRPSIQWSRLIPDGVGQVNPRAVEFYRDVFQQVNALGIKLLVNLYHFDLPYALQEKGGWESKETVWAYEAYARKCFELFGDLVDHWVTFNEPIVPVECGYLGSYHYPCKVDAKAAVAVAYHTQLASSLAVKACHELHPDHQISIVLNLTPAYPRSDSPEDQKAARIAELFQTKSFLDPSVLGAYPEELVAIIDEYGLRPDVTEEELAIIRENTVDFLGVNYYQPLRVQAPKVIFEEGDLLTTEHFFASYDMPGKKINPHRGWEIYERGLYDIAMNLKKDYGNIVWLVTENGMGVEGEEAFKEDGYIQDDYRIEFIQDHLIELHRAIQEGANCKGYMLWTFIDCWSWLNAYKNRYGLVELDLSTQKRIIKKSGYWFKEVSQANGFSR